MLSMWFRGDGTYLHSTAVIDHRKGLRIAGLEGVRLCNEMPSFYIEGVSQLLSSQEEYRSSLLELGLYAVYVFFVDH